MGQDSKGQDPMVLMTLWDSGPYGPQDFIGQDHMCQYPMGLRTLWT